MNIQEKLNYLKIEYGITYKTMAEQSNVSYEVIRKVAQGRNNPNEENNRKLREYLKNFSYEEGE